MLQLKYKHAKIIINIYVFEQTETSFDVRFDPIGVHIGGAIRFKIFRILYQHISTKYRGVVI